MAAAGAFEYLKTNSRNCNKEELYFTLKGNKLMRGICMELRASFILFHLSKGHNFSLWYIVFKVVKYPSQPGQRPTINHPDVLHIWGWMTMPLFTSKNHNFKVFDKVPPIAFRNVWIQRQSNLSYRAPVLKDHQCYETALSDPQKFMFLCGSPVLRDHIFSVPWAVS